MRLALPGFVLTCGGPEGQLEFAWAGAGVFDVRVACCVAATLHAGGPDGGCQLVFRFRMGPEHGSAPVVIRVDVTPEWSRSAEEFMRAVWEECAIPDRPEADSPAVDFERTPHGAGWLRSPAAPASEELFQLVMAHVNADDI
ncbi:hypothetical protein ACFYM2_34430 [Streptomyces sp. NPDC006711]|uniref:hypothetical protein n=1 Tax=unclassified Streptomyces TaxID=2593676 RepID=UPI0036887049